MGNALRDATAAAVVGKPCLDRFVLIVMASMADDRTGAFFASLYTVATLCGTQVSAVRRIVRRHEGGRQAYHEHGERGAVVGLTPGRFLYPEGAPSAPGQGVPTRYRFAVPGIAVPPTKRTAKNPNGNNSSAPRTSFRLPDRGIPYPPTPGVSHTPPLPPSTEGGGVSHTPHPGMGYPTGGVSHTPELNELSELRGVPPLPTPRLHEREAGGGPPASISPPSRTIAHPRDFMLNRATALRQQAQEDMETREGEGKENRPTGTNGPLTDHESNAP